MTPRIFLVDDDDAVRDALSRLLASLGLPVTACADGAALLAACTPEHPGCIVLDLDLPGGMNGLGVQAAARQRGIGLPIIFLTGKGSVSSTASALKAGAFDFLEKPVEGRLLLARVQDALQEDARRREGEARRSQTRSRLEQLTHREREVIALALEGLMNKQIASRLGISHRTVEIHRSRVIRKMGASSLLELDRMFKSGEPDSGRP
jgi:FixJ family two-component response regulator